MTAPSYFKRSLLVLGSLSSLLIPSMAHAFTGLCDDTTLTPPGPDQCIAQIQAATGVVVNDVFTDSNGATADMLPTYGVLYNQWPGCDFATFAGCAGYDVAPYDCPGEYACDGTVTNTFANASARMSGPPDHLWWHPCRTSNHNLDANGCPQYVCVADGDASGYNPWEGLVFDLGGPSNKVAIFATNDHGPQPCESLEYTIYLSDNPFAKEKIDTPLTDGVDPQKWNRAVLNKIYTDGWVKIRQTPDPSGHAACGDTADYAVEQDSFAQVFALPCGITFRYAAVIAGNDGLDFPACQYASSEAELDSVAGLTESGAGVCPDADGDHYVDCNCPTAPPVCDCNDSDPNVHPGAPEACDATVDLNCDGMIGTMCPAGEKCENSICLAPCSGSGEFTTCPNGFTCDADKFCKPVDCGCAPGQVCVNNTCVDACQGVDCPGDQVCQDGQCIDPCANIQCPAGTTCSAGVCSPPCNCYAGDIGCTGGLVCDRNATNSCTTPACVGAMCTGTQTCDPTSGTCVDLCNPMVVCPLGQTCVAGQGCVDLCAGVTCPSGKSCDPTTGNCKAAMCDASNCPAPAQCVNGACVGGTNAGGGPVFTSSATGQGGSQGTSSDKGGGVPFVGAGGGDANGIGQTGGCCGVAGGESPEGRGAAALALMALGLVVANRRRARR